MIVVVREQGPSANGMPEPAPGDAVAVGAAASRVPGRAHHRRPHVGSVRRDPGRHPPHARGRARRPDRAAAGR
nr:hypothetical protein [Angustibacter aerolatus]